MILLKTLRRLFPVALIGVLSLPAQAVNYTDGIAAVVGDEVITVSEVIRRASPVEQSLTESYQGDDLMEKITALRKHVARQIIEEELLYLEYQARGMQLPREYVDSRLDRLVVSQAGGSYEKFRGMLTAENLTFEEYREQLTKKLAVQILVDQMVRRQITVTMEEIDQFYRDNPTLFQTPNAVHLGVIFLKQKSDSEIAKTAQQRARAVMTTLKKAPETDFAALAKDVSDDKISAEKGGDLGWIETDTGRQAFIDAVQGLKPGQIAAPVAQPEGIYILKLKDVREAEAPVLDDTLRAQIRKRLENSRFETQLDEFLTTLRRKYFVKTFIKTDR